MKRGIDMNNNLSWLEMITVAMQKLGGHAIYRDLYNMVEYLYPEKTNSVVDFKAQIRGTIERFSSDSDVYHATNSKKDLFGMYGNKGDGHWFLRDFQPSITNVDLTDDDEGFPEGKQKLITHVCRERNYKVVKEAKSRFKDKHGKLVCEVCGFNFSEKYGEIGDDYIEAHHIIPVSELKENDKTKVDDIALVCSNCHRMLHRKRPWITPSDLKSLLK